MWGLCIPLKVSSEGVEDHCSKEKSFLCKDANDAVISAWRAPLMFLTQGELQLALFNKLHAPRRAKRLVHIRKVIPYMMQVGVPKHQASYTQLAPAWSEAVVPPLATEKVSRF